LGLLAFIVLWLWFCYRREFLRNATVASAVILVILGTRSFVDFATSDTNLSRRLERTGDDAGDLKREKMYSIGTTLILENPVTGVGLGNFNSRSGMGLYSHSDYMEVLSTTGLVGAALYFPIYFIWWRRLSRVSKGTHDPEVRYQVRLFQAILLTMLMLGTGVPNFMQTEQWYWIAAMIGYTHALDTEISEARLRDSHVGVRSQLVRS
jgi:O-antigen ligase